jgi:hypothetical protein
LISADIQTWQYRWQGVNDSAEFVGGQALSNEDILGNWKNKKG